VNSAHSIRFAGRTLACASLCAAFVVCAAPRITLAQAPPGPMHPVEHSTGDDPTGYGEVTVRHKPPRPAYKTDLAGVWKFNQDDSDDIIEKLKEARQGSGGRDDGSNNGQNSPRQNNGGIHMGGMGSPYPGGTGSGGGNNGAGNPRSKGANGTANSELSVNNPTIEEYTTPANQLTFVIKDPNEYDMTDDAARQRTYFFDDRKIPKPSDSAKPSDPRQYDAYFEGENLVAKDDLPHAVRVTRQFQPQPGGMQLIEHVTIETNHSNGYVELNLAYDRVGTPPPPPAPPKPQPQQATAAPASNGGSHAITSTTTANGSSSGSSDPNAPPATIPNATQGGASDAPTLKRPSNPQ
jgi:hypothetical protein